jgi:hypothetical protein
VAQNNERTINVIMTSNIPIPVVATPIACSNNPSSVGPAICGYTATIIPKPRTPMPVARSDIQLIFSIAIPAVQTPFLLLLKT